MLRWRLTTGLAVCALIGMMLAAARPSSVTASQAAGWQIAGAVDAATVAPSMHTGGLVIAGGRPVRSGTEKTDGTGPSNLGSAALQLPALIVAAVSPAIAQDRREVRGGSGATASRNDDAASGVSFSKVVIRPEGGSRLEGLGPSGAEISLLLNGLRVQRVRVGTDRRWEATVGARLTSGEHRIAVVSDLAGPGSLVPDEEIRIAVPHETLRREIVAVDRTQPAVAEESAGELRRRAEDLARASSRRFTELTEQEPGSNGVAGHQRQDGPAGAAKAPPPGSAPARSDERTTFGTDGGASSEPTGFRGETVFDWLEYTQSQYGAVIVPGLSEPRRVPPLASGATETAASPAVDRTPRGGNWPALPDQSGVVDWLSRANETYQRELVMRLTVPGPTETVTEPASVTQRSRLAEAAIERENVRRAEAERRQAERAERQAEDERQLAERRVAEADEALRREGEQRAQAQRQRAAEAAAQAAERARRQRIEAEIAEAERREKIAALAARLEADRQAAERRRQLKLDEEAAAAARQAAESERRQAEQRAATDRAARQTEDTPTRGSARVPASETERSLQAIERKAERTDRVDALLAQARDNEASTAVEEAAAKAALRQLLQDKAAAKAAEPAPAAPPDAQPQRPLSAVPEARTTARPAPRAVALALVPLPEPAPQRPVRVVVEEGSGERGPVLASDARRSLPPTPEPAPAAGRATTPLRVSAAREPAPVPNALGSTAATGSLCRLRGAGRRVKLPGSYIVQRGDTLWTIAARHYGRGRSYVVITRANRRKIGSPHRIYPCQRFWLPRLGR
ncbi:MAG: LysM peptidoglycan-binding domain-containing protein [Hyphomicrobiaceae bacterium]|nr:LysM peptidoglycan-binding domain-containing protein [Hyphomicrobiaceae bacterium]